MVVGAADRGPAHRTGGVGGHLPTLSSIERVTYHHDIGAGAKIVARSANRLVCRGAALVSLSNSVVADHHAGIDPDPRFAPTNEHPAGETSESRLRKK